MAKNKKNKVVSLKPVNLSPENYIKTQARSLPVKECLVTEGWETAGICTVIVAREHKTGNITAGIYLVDMFCLGLKSADHRFNITPDEYQDMVNYYPSFDECEYDLAHNIVYGAIAYAEDLGFKPHKDFGVARFLLEEDDDDVPLIELDFGLNGKPLYMTGPYDSEATVRSITAILTRTVGEGNFSIMDGDDLDDDFDEDDFDDEDDFEDADYPERSANRKLLKMVTQINAAYADSLLANQTEQDITNEPIGEAYTLTEDYPDNLYDKFDDEAQQDEYDFLRGLVFAEHDYEQAITKLTEAIAKYPGRAQFYTLLHAAYILSGEVAEASAWMKNMHDTFPDYLPYRVDYANDLLDTLRTEEALNVFERKTDLNQLYPEQKQFNIKLAAMYYGCMCRYYALIEDVVSADKYMNVLLEYDLIERYGTQELNEAIYAFCDLKLAILGDSTDVRKDML